MVVENCQFAPTLPLFGTTVGGDSVGISPIAEIFGTRKLDLWAIVRRCMRDPMFSRFRTVPSCDRRMDRQTHDDSIYRASIASRGNKTVDTGKSLARYFGIIKQVTSGQCIVSQRQSIKNYDTSRVSDTKSLFSSRLILQLPREHQSFSAPAQ